MLRFTHSSTHTVCDNAGRIREVLSQEIECLYSKAITVQSE